MKTGRTAYQIPSPETVLRDVKKVFVRVRMRIAKMLQVWHKFHFLDKKKLKLTCNKTQEYPGALSFATDGWTSPNHKAYIAVTVHFEKDGVPVSMLLDIVEVAQLHSGVNLAAAFAKILGDFGISDKVSLKKKKEE